ncbi:MAG TPA: surface lipoprotein assembly modifier [Terriglobia bacterium]|nr:surface lipoprotein assembly modifier [Terriglobia bacterium]
MRSRWCSTVLCGLITIASAIPALAFPAAPEDDIKALLDKGNAAAAYELGRKNPDQLGNPAFDFYFGIAAIDSSHAGEGVLALERYCINFPDNLNARLELARGYFVMGDDLRASEEFDSVLKTDPPAPVRANIQRFIDAMHTRESVYRTKMEAYAETGFGYDTNANGGVSNADINLPVFGNVTVDTAGIHAESAFEWLTAAAQISHPLAPGLAVFGEGRVDGTYHRKAQSFDQNNLAISGGASFVKNKDLFRATASRSQLKVDDVRFRSVNDVSGEWLHQFNELETFSLSGQYAQLRYPAGNQPRDANFSAAGVGYSKAFIRMWRPQLIGNANAGREEDIRDRPDLGRYIYGGRAALAIALSEKWGASIGGNYQTSRYQGDDTLLLTRRKDHNYAADAVVSYACSRKLSVRAEFLVSQNDSNLALYEYRRSTVTLKVRYAFK